MKPIQDYFKKSTKKTTKSTPKKKQKSLDLVAKKETPNDDSSDFPDLETFKGQLLSWRKMLDDVIEHSTFTSIHQKVKQRYATEKCYPPPEMIFNAFNVTHLKDLKIIIVGQDPYIKPGQAMGLCFSVPKGIKIPPSLRNMYKCLDKDVNIKGNSNKIRFYNS
jgi:uracil-DNA glycosylase